MTACSLSSRQAREHFERRDIEMAISLYTRALEEGENPAEHVNERWACWMLLGKFEQAWQESDRVGTSFREGPADHVLIHCLRGFGDAVQFLRYLPLLQDRFGNVAVQAPARLVPLLERLPFDRVFPFEDPNALRYKTALECSDLPYVFRTTLDRIPAPLSIPVNARSTSARRVGLMWTAGEWNPARAIPFELLAPLLTIPNTDFVSLELETEGWDFRSQLLPRREPNLLATVEHIGSLDLVITVDTLIAHLAGSLGKAVWTLLPFHADWRWMLGRVDSPWYPSMTLFRQKTPGNWTEMLGRVAARLRAWRC